MAEPGEPEPLVSASEARERGAASGPVRVFGRIARFRGSELQLWDAWGGLPVRLATEHASLAEGAWALVEGELAGRRLERARVVETHHGAPQPRGDWQRCAEAGLGVRLRARARAMRGVRRYFDELGFVEVDTPTRLPAPGLDLHIEAIASAPDWLVVSPEHHMKRLLTGGLGKLYQLVHCHRGEELGPLHEPEFALLEWYRAFASWERLMEDTEQLVSLIVSELSGDNWVEHAGLRCRVDAPFERLTVRDAYRRFAGIPDAAQLAANDEERFFQLLVDRVEPGLSGLKRPVFLCEYPVTQAALARPVPSDPDVAERFELYVAGVELCNGYGEFTDAGGLRARMERERLRRIEAGRVPYPLDERFLSAMHEGMPPASGNALGFDRLLMLALSADSLADVVAFPHADR